MGKRKSRSKVGNDGNGQPPEVMAQMRASLAKKRIATKKRRCQMFLEHYAMWGIVSQAARFAQTAIRTIYEWRDADPVFAKAMAEAFEKSTELLEREALRRARKGVKRNVLYKGEKVDTVRDYSDVLLIFMLKARKPDVYRERYDIRHGGSVSIEPMRIYLPGNEREVIVAGRLVDPKVLPEHAGDDSSGFELP